MADQEKLEAMGAFGGDDQ